VGHLPRPKLTPSKTSLEAFWFAKSGLHFRECLASIEEYFEQSFGVATTGGLHDRFHLRLVSYRPFAGSAEQSEPCAVTINPDVWEARDERMKS